MNKEEETRFISIFRRLILFKFILLFNTPLEKISEIKMSNAQRRFLLDKILVFYTLHTASFGEVQSHKILEALLS